LFSGLRARRFIGLLALAACSRSADRAASSAPIDIVDDAGFAVRLDKPAARIISLIPSATETLVALGAREQLVGRTRYDTDSAVAALPSVGGGIDPSIETIISLQPDLVVSWESDKRMVLRETLGRLGVPVFILRSQDTTDVLRGIERLGRLAGRDSAANAVASRVRATLDSVRATAAARDHPRVMYVAYDQPPMTAGRETFIGQLIGVAGGASVFDDLEQLWPNVSMEEVLRRDPDVLIVPVGEMTTPIDRLRDLPGWRDLRAVREGRVRTVPADLLNRPGPRIAESAVLLLRAIHGDSVR
jgi:iron complex transport system substrate-binding protein